MSGRTDDAIHPIGVAAERAGMTPDLIRAWERRYGVVEPRRDEAGRRVYTTADIERLRLLARATVGGRSIGQVVELEDARLEDLVRQDEAARRPVVATEVPASAGEVVAVALERTRALDARGLEAVLVRSAAAYGIPQLLRGVVAPLFRGIGELWHRGELTPAQEHLASATVRSTLDRLLGGMPVLEEAPVLVVATPAGERHEIGALLAAAAATVEGWRVVFLGGDLPALEIAQAAEATGARAVALGAVYAPDPSSLRAEVDALRTALGAGRMLLLGGPAAGAYGNGHPPRDGIAVIAGLDDLVERLRSLARS